MKQLTLQNRITSIMIISCVLFISTFIFIQISSEINNVTIFNSFTAKLNGFIVRDSLEGLLSKSTDSSEQEIKKTLNTQLVNLVINKVISDGSIVNTTSDKIIASTNEELIDQEIEWKDSKIIDALTDENSTEKWFDALVDKDKHIIILYIPIKNHNDIYIAKIEFPLSNIKETLAAIYKPAILATIIIIIATTILGLLLTKMVIGPIKLLNNATKEVSEGKLESKVNINTGDELQELADTFNEMEIALKEMRKRAEDANPLTKLPGNIVIHEEVTNRIKLNIKFTVIHADLGNFKAYNDHYGLAQGDEAIKLCADILKEAVKTNGNKEDLVGHGGGDDFILVTTPDKAEPIANYIIEEFDSRIVTLYNEEDRKNGYIIAHSRTGEMKKFSIMTISLSGVSNATRTISSFSEVTNIDAEIKHIVKEMEKSAFLMDRRTS